jgi:hypothetical protein
VYVYSDSWPFVPKDLSARRLERRNDPSVCPGQAALWFQPPQPQENGLISLDVVEATGTRGLAGGQTYLFRCTGEECRLKDQLPLTGDYIQACRA